MPLTTTFTTSYCDKRRSIDSSMKTIRLTNLLLICIDAWLSRRVWEPSCRASKTLANRSLRRFTD